MTGSTPAFMLDRARADGALEAEERTTTEPTAALRKCQVASKGTPTIKLLLTSAKAHGLTARSKHFERWAAYVRDLYQ